MIDPKPVPRTKARPRTDKVAAALWWAEVMAATCSKSALSGKPASVCHHIVDQQKIRRAGLGEHVRWDARNGMALTEDEHRRHHNRVAPILRGQLPERVFEFAAEYGFTEWLERRYPESIA